MHYSIVSPGPGGVISQDQFETSLRNGAFSVILDGFDEVDFDQRKNIEQQILEMRDKYPELLLIVSSRPDPESRFESWSRFHVAYVRPMEEDQILELIEKVDYDHEIKKQFIKALKESLFRSHKSFLSNPLLSMMMLVTFEQSGHIPGKKHIFYERAFEALFFLHDTAKEGAFKRKTYANLPIDEFKHCLSAFCLVFYAKEKFSFTAGDLQDIITQALRIEKKEIDIDDFKSDLIESTCLLQREGLECVFTHRSFQEYFTALFIARSPATGIAQLLDQLSRRREDEVVSMAFAMNRHLIEREWILPRLQSLLTLSSAFDPKRDLVGYIQNLFGGTFSMRVHGGKPGEFYLGDIKTNGHVWLAIIALHSSHFDQLYTWVRRQKSADGPILQEALETLKRNDDPRLPPRDKRRRGSFELVLQPSDTEWLLKTRVPEYFSRQQKIIGALLKSIEGDVENQRDILSQLLP